MQYYRVKIVGETPLVMNNNAIMLDGPVDRGADKAKYDREHYLEKCYRDYKGKLIIPSDAIKAMLVAGCSFITDSPRQYGIRRQSFAPVVDAAVFVRQDGILGITDEKVHPWTAIVNLNPKLGPKGPRGPRTRPRISPPWSTETLIMVADDAMKAEILQKIATAAGVMCGLLDGRKKGMGRCKVMLEVCDEPEI
jgi:hypothetical protein